MRAALIAAALVALLSGCTPALLERRDLCRETVEELVEYNARFDAAMDAYHGTPSRTREEAARRFDRFTRDVQSLVDQEYEVRRGAARCLGVSPPAPPQISPTGPKLPA